MSGTGPGQFLPFYRHICSLGKTAYSGGGDTLLACVVRFTTAFPAFISPRHVFGRSQVLLPTEKPEDLQCIARLIIPSVGRANALRAYFPHRTRT
jgi:hypothetical protein